jgi:hypothetical protein
VDISSASLSGFALVGFGLVGLALIGYLLYAVLTRTSDELPEDSFHREIERLFTEISRRLRSLSAPSRAGGLFYREKQEELGRMLSELQARLRLLEDADRLPYEARAGQVLAAAARAGITVPPLEAPLINTLSRR